MITVTDEKLFGTDGSLLKIQETNLLVDTIALIVMNGGDRELSVASINLELRKCGFFQSMPQVQAVLLAMEKDGLVKNMNRPEKPDLKVES